jgi:hypothetical protein
VSYQVFVDENFHYMDEDERYCLGEFESLDAAVAKCREIVDAFLAANYKAGMTADQLYQQYTGFGEDPFIRGGDEAGFSAWDYAKARCEEICGSTPPKA